MELNGTVLVLLEELKFKEANEMLKRVVNNVKCYTKQIKSATIK